MKLMTSLAAVLTAFTLCAEPAAGENLFLNGDFSEGMKHWLFENKAINVSPEIKFNDKAVVVIPGNSEIRQNFTIKPDTDYVLTYSVKGENIKSPNPRNKGARFMLNANKKWLRATTLAHGGCMVGTFDWVKGEYRFNSTKDLGGGGKLTIKLVLDCEGTLYAADIALKEVPKLDK